MWQRNIKKTIFTLNIGYPSEITDITYPLIEQYAKKIGAHIHIINTRHFPDMPVVYEKFQIYELAKMYDNEWNIYVDSDALIHPDFMDVTTLISKDTVMQYGCDFLSRRFNTNREFIRDGRNIGCCNWFTVASDLCIDIWDRPSEDKEVLFDQIHPIAPEVANDINRTHFIDDYIMSYNVARYGIKYTTLRDRLKEIGQQGCEYLYHNYLAKDKSSDLLKTLQRWAKVGARNLHPLDSEYISKKLTKGAS